MRRHHVQIVRRNVVAGDQVKTICEELRIDLSNTETNQGRAQVRVHNLSAHSALSDLVG